MQNKITLLTNKFISLLAILSLASCDNLLNTADPELVMEGWIEMGMPPIVMLSSTIPVSLDEFNVSDLDQYTVTNGKVTISDGEKTVELVGKADSRYFTGYIYTTDEMIGDLGKTYSIRAEYGNNVITGSSSIPHAAALEDINIIPQNNGTYDILARIVHSEDAAGYYSFVSRNLDSVYYQPSILGMSTRNDEWGRIGAPINNYPYSHSTSFIAGETVYLRFSAMEENILRYWENMDSNVTLNHNMFLPSFKNIVSSVEGGYGYWAGYNSFTTVIKIPESL